jgi:hypothetical protein
VRGIRNRIPVVITSFGTLSPWAGQPIGTRNAIVELEDQLQRVKVRKKTDRSAHYYNVRPLFLEHLKIIYDALDSSLGPTKELRQKEIEELAEREDRARNRKLEIAFEASKRYLQEPLIKMRNDEYEFTSLAQVAAIKRRAFREFTFSTSTPFHWVSITPSGVYVAVSLEAANADEVFAILDALVRSRMSLFSTLLSMRWTPFVPLAAYLVAITIAGVLDLDRAVFSVITAVLLAVILFIPLALLIYSRRTRVVVPRFQSEVETFWDRGGIEKITGILAVILSIAAIVVAIWIG